MNSTKQGFSVCSIQHGIWRCSRFKGSPYHDKMKIVLAFVEMLATMQGYAPEQISNARKRMQ